MTNTRSKIACNNPSLCGARWHWSDTATICGSDPSIQRRAVDELAAYARRPATLAGREEVYVGTEGLALEFTEESWEKFCESAVAVHGLQVNRHALVSVMAGITAGTADAQTLRSDPDTALAFEVLCLDEDVRSAAVTAALGEDLAKDESSFNEASEDLVRLLAEARGMDPEDVHGVQENFDDFPYLKARVAGLVEASYEAQKQMHAYQAMVTAITTEMYDSHPERHDAKWTVRNGKVSPYDATDLRTGDVVANISHSRGSYDPGAARKALTDEEWGAALALTQDSDIGLTPAALRKEAQARDIDITPFVSEDTSKVVLMTAEHGADLEDFTEDRKSAKAHGEAAFREGFTKFGSRFYVPSREDMSEEKAFATLVGARARADLRRNEAKGVADLIKATLRRVEPVAVNTTLRYADSGRDFLFQVNRTAEFDKDGFMEMYPDVVADMRQQLRDEGKVTPPRAVLEHVLDNTNYSSLSGADLDDFRKSPTRRPLLSVVDGEGQTKEPSKLGAEAAKGRISRGEALNGHVLTEALAN